MWILSHLNKSGVTKGKPKGAPKAFIDFVNITRGHNLGISGNNLNPGRFSGPTHGREDSPEIRLWKSGLNDQSGAQKQRPGAAYGHIIDGAVNGEITNIAAREKDRIHHNRRSLYPCPKPAPSEAIKVFPVRGSDPQK